MLSPYLSSLVQRASQDVKTIVLPEGEDERVLQAAYLAVQNNVAKPIVLGNPIQIKDFFAKKGWSLDGIEVIEPEKSEHLAEYTNLLFELRKAKGMSEDEAQKTALNYNYFGTLMMKAGHADGMVSGANHSTADTVRPALQIIKSKNPNMGVSSFFIMVSSGKPFILSDCGLVIKPSEKELADIAVTAATSAVMFGIEPTVAMLSYSTKGSGKGEDAEKVRAATALALETLKTEPYNKLNIKIDGELQADAALDMTVASKKAPQSEVAGNARVLIVPDLNTGNISYKLLQRLGGCEAYGPILQGLNAPINDLSRGALVEDILGTIAITAIQAQNK
ncbi:MAG: phosphate acetyltransferase [Alphaproteobacteria bacterium]|nr:phosphate acetyltransferase [Alphaproteobacteria bacterium]